MSHARQTVRHGAPSPHPRPDLGFPRLTWALCAGLRSRRLATAAWRCGLPTGGRWLSVPRLYRLRHERSLRPSCLAGATSPVSPGLGAHEEVRPVSAPSAVHTTPCTFAAKLASFRFRQFSMVRKTAESMKPNALKVLPLEQGRWDGGGAAFWGCGVVRLRLERLCSKLRSLFVHCHMSHQYLPSRTAPMRGARPLGTERVRGAPCIYLHLPIVPQ